MTLPVPVFVAGESVTQFTAALAVQLHPTSVVTVRSTFVPAAEADTSAGLTVNAQGDAACVTANCEPLIEIFPLRAVPCGFDWPVSAMAASPCPEAGDTSSHDELLVAVQPHSRCVTTPTSTRPPAAGMVGTVWRDVWQREESGAVISVTLVDPHPRE